MEIRYRSNLTAGIISVGLGMLCWIIIPYQIGEDYALTYGITSKTIPYAVSVLWIICGAALIIHCLVFKREEIKSLQINNEFKAGVFIGVLVFYAFLFQINFLLSSIFLGVIRYKI